MAIHLGYNDAILFASLLYSSIDVRSEWASFSQCRRPIHQWLLVSFVLVITFRITHILGAKAAPFGSEDFLIDLRQKHLLPRFLASFTWFFALPSFAFWTLLGSKWLWDVVAETPACVPSPTHLWFSVFWLGLCYVWIIIHAALGGVAWLLELRVRKAESDLRQIEDSDVRSRWGPVSTLQGYSSLAGSGHSGLTPPEINALPCFTCTQGLHEAGVGEDTECPICLHALQPGDTMRQLEKCGHIFHRSCIDLWLLRSFHCPLCKQSVR